MYKRKKQNLKWKETRGNEGKRGEREGGKCSFNGSEACKKLPRKEEQNKEKNPRTPTLPLPLKPNQSKMDKKSKRKKI